MHPETLKTVARQSERARIIARDFEQVAEENNLPELASLLSKMWPICRRIDFAIARMDTNTLDALQECNDELQELYKDIKDCIYSKERGVVTGIEIDGLRHKNLGEVVGYLGYSIETINREIVDSRRRCSA